MHEFANGRFCCKSLFALLIKNSKGYRRDVRVNMWGTSSPDDKLVSDLAKAAEATKIGARGLDRLMAGKLSPLNFGLLQQYRHERDVPTYSGNVGSSRRSRPNAGVLLTAGFDPTRDISGPLLLRCTAMNPFQDPAILSPR